MLAKPMFDGLSQILLLLAASVIAVALFRRVRLPPILGYLLVGVLLGPHALGLVEETDDMYFIAEFGVVFLLFTLGLEFSLPRMIAMRREVFGLGTLQVVVTTILFGAIAMWLLGVSIGIAIVIGGTLAMSSTAIVAKQLADQFELVSPHGRHAIAILLFQDLAVVFFLILIPTLTAAEHSMWRELVQAVITAAIAVSAVLFAGRRLLRPLFHEIARARIAEQFRMAVLLIALAAAWSTQALGLSPALGAFLAGMMLGETEYRHQVEADIRPFRDIFLGLFFVTVGMLLDTRLLASYVIPIVTATGLLIVLKMILITVLTRGFADGWADASRTGVVLAQGGEFGIALLTLTIGHALIGEQPAQILLAAIVLSMAISPLLIRHNATIVRRLIGADEEKDHADVMEIDQATRELAKHEHVVICGFGRVGQNVARFLEEENIDYTALDLDPFRVRAARRAGDPVSYGDAARPEILEAVGLSQATAVVISFPDTHESLKVLEAVRSRRNDVPVVVRTRDDTDLDQLQQAGATEVVPETLEGSLMLAAHVLFLLKTPVSKILWKIQHVRNKRYSLLRSLFPKEDARQLDASHSLREQLNTVTLPPKARAVGMTLGDLDLDAIDVTVTALRRDEIVGRQPGPETELHAGDTLVLFARPEDLERAEEVLLQG